VAEKLNILLIEDNPGDARLVAEALREKAQLNTKLTIADCLSQGQRYIATEHIHVILLDLNLPDSQGIETFKKIQKFAFDAPIIIMSIVSDKELIFQAMKEGAQDYLIKGQLTHESLIRAIRYACWSHQKSEQGIRL
jgi:DNA-binding NarL/FixJ family response regulator